jgi:LysM repeat protein
MIERPAAPSADPESATAALAACPHLVSVDGSWHGAAPSRAHRCRLLASGRPTLDRQREHCLAPAHVVCPTWLESHGDAGPRERPGPYAPMTTVILEGAGLGLPSEAAARRMVAPATVVVVGVALGALVLARGPLAPPTSGAGDGGQSPTATATQAAATAAPGTEVTPAPTQRPVATQRPVPSSEPSATARPSTYKVKSGDTLSAVAARFETTVAEIAALNGITNPSLIRVGQVLKIP